MTMMYTIHPFVGDCSVVFDWLKSALPLPKGTGLAASAGHSTAILVTELIVCAMDLLTAHLGGFLERREWRPVNSRFEATVNARSTTYKVLILLQLRTLSA
jgi:hypothetical protein